MVSRRSGLSTLQVAKETLMCILQVLCSHRWIPGYLDFTQAFHSGDQIERVQNAEQLAEGIPGMKPRQLWQLPKRCCRLLDGPYAWFRHLGRLLVEDLGHEASIADPCCFYLFDEKRSLVGITCQNIICPVRRSVALT